MSFLDFIEAILSGAGASFDYLNKHDGAITAIATVVIAAFTIALARSTRKLWEETKASSGIAAKSAEAALKTATAMEHSERAYVKISHHPPGLVFPPSPLAPISVVFAVQIVVKNLGRTPATITDVILNQWIVPQTGLLPITPQYDAPHTQEEAPRIFLYRDDPFTVWKQFTVSTQGSADIQSGTQTWYLYGYVDYIDKFGQRHRAGYGRFYERNADDPANYNPPEDFFTRSNLFFITQRGYNYDRTCEPSEGNDWDKPN